MNASLHVLAPRSLTDAVKAAAARELTSNSEYVRRAVIARLRADGIEPRDATNTVSPRHPNDDDDEDENGDDEAEDDEPAVIREPDDE